MTTEVCLHPSLDYNSLRNLDKYKTARFSWSITQSECRWRQRHTSACYVGYPCARGLTDLWGGGGERGWKMVLTTRLEFDINCNDASYPALQNLYYFQISSSDSFITVTSEPASIPGGYIWDEQDSATSLRVRSLHLSLFARPDFSGSNISFPVLTLALAADHL